MSLSCTISKTLVGEIDHRVESKTQKSIKSQNAHTDGSIRTDFKRSLGSSIPQLSKSTQDVIEKIKKERIIEERIKEERILNPNNPVIFSQTKPSEKFSYLLSENKSLPLPSSYQKLIRLFRALDQTISFFQYNRSPLQFLRVQDAVEKTYCFRCSLEEVQQIMSVYPESYKLTWNINGKEVLLFIDFFDGKVKERDELGLRKKYFDEAIFDFVDECHQKFLVRNGLMWVSKENWHPNFPISNLPHLPLASLPEKPEIKTSQVMDFVTHLVSLQSNPPTNIENVVVEGTIEGISPALAAKILAKESILQAKRLELVESAVIKEHNQGEKVLKIVEILRTLFFTQKTPSMFLNILIGKLSGIMGNKNYRMVEEDLRETVSLFPGFLAIIKTNSGEVFRFTKLNDFKLVDARQELKAKFDMQ